MKSNKSIAKLQSHIFQKKEEKYNGMCLCDNRKSFMDHKNLIKLSHTTNKLTTQMLFNTAANQATIINNYTDAFNAWNDSLAQVNAFVPAYAADPNFANENMENNMVQKSIKAATTCAGEAFETHRWRPGALNTYFGPGDIFGVDIKHFTNTNNPNAIGTASEEVKSSNNVNWRDLFNFTPPGVRRIAFLSGAALANALASPPPQLFQTRYEYYNKANPGVLAGICH